MLMDVEASKQEFRRLVDEAFGSEELMALLLALRERADLTPGDRGWVLWNICDQYALGREAVPQHGYQAEFFELTVQSFPERAHWVVSDSTQARTLIHGGFTDFWWDCYQFANQQAPCVPESRGARFEAHRTNAGSYAFFGEAKRARCALEGLASLLKEDPKWPGQEFASATYDTLLIQFYGVTGQMDHLDETAEDLERMLFAWRARIGEAEPGPWERPMLGSWAYLNAPRPPANALRVAMANAGCACAENGRFAAAERLFRGHWSGGRALTAYCAARFLQSCWRNRHDRDEIARLLREARSLTAEYLVEVAPEMAEAVPCVPEE
jgi:hypothetical protein